MMSENGLDLVHVKLVRSAQIAPDRTISTSEDAVHAVREMIRDLDREMVVMINLTEKGTVVNASVCSIGTLTGSLVNIPGILRTAVLSGCDRFIMLHNHPSGSVKPSDQDKMATVRMSAAARLMQLELTDHIIVGGDQAYSFKHYEPELFEQKIGIIPDENMDHYAFAAEVGEKKGPYQIMRESREKLVNDVIRKIRSGEFTYTYSWNRAALRPQNPVSGTFYRGGNRLRLMCAVTTFKYSDPRWMTFKQAQKMGYSVKKGEHGVRLEKWIFDKQEKVRDPQTGKIEEKRVPMDRPYCYQFVVFNADQIDGLPPLPEREDISGDGLNKLADAMIESWQCPIYETGQEESYYTPSKDAIFLPPREYFSSTEQFIKVMSHEMVHSTGHESRLNRTFGRWLPLQGPDKNYCIEELRAELGAFFIVSDLGVCDKAFDLENSSAYLDNYLGVIKEDPNLLFQIARDSEKAEEMILNELKNVYPIDMTVDPLPPKEEVVDVPEYEEEAAVGMRL